MHDHAGDHVRWGASDLFRDRGPRTAWGSATDFFSIDQIFDLFCDPVPAITQSKTGCSRGIPALRRARSRVFVFASRPAMNARSSNIPTTLRNRIIAGARAHDDASIEDLIELLPDPLPREFLNNRSRRAIKSIARWIASVCPGMRDREIATVIAVAGHLLQSHRGAISDTPPFSRFTADERRRLEREVRDVLAWNPADPIRWPTAETIRKLTRD